MSRIGRFYRAFRWGVLVALIAVLGMVLRTPAPPAVTVSEDAPQRVEQKVRRLATPDGRIAGSLRLDEGEVNGCARHQGPSGRGPGDRLRSFQPARQGPVSHPLGPSLGAGRLPAAVADADEPRLDAGPQGRA